MGHSSLSLVVRLQGILATGQHVRFDGWEVEFVQDAIHVLLFSAGQFADDFEAFIECFLGVSEVFDSFHSESAILADDMI